MPSRAIERPLALDSLLLDDVNLYDIWDRRESAVANPELYRDAATAYTRAAPEFLCGIPAHIHQIWIGKRQPPCVWLDTWRVDYMRLFGDSDDVRWGYTLWDNDKAASMDMLNRDLFDAEDAPQCQADILRLELLYQHGGVYIDADVVSTKRDLTPILHAARDTGFAIAYEPDTKDKPYSVLGNSIIFATKRHPLVLMLMSYIRAVHAAKRAHYGVEWVTGPLTYTKVLIHAEMPITLVPSAQLYPMFHYVPNPSAVDVSKLDDKCYCVQFGYTCSGLSDWVARNNTCRNAHGCAHHRTLTYPLGKLRPFPSTLPTIASRERVTSAEDVPQIIHQVWLEDGHKPERWLRSWSEGFCTQHGYEYELWTCARLREEIGEWFAANLYVNPAKMSEHVIRLLMVEVLHKRGGVYVPVANVCPGDSEKMSEVATMLRHMPRVGDTEEEMIFGRGDVLAAAPGALAGVIERMYGGEEALAVNEEEEEDEEWSDVLNCGISDHVCQTARFRSGSRFLGAGAIVYAPQNSDVSAAEVDDGLRMVTAWAYDCQVRVWNAGRDGLRVLREASKVGRVVVVTDCGIGEFGRVVDEVGGTLLGLDEAGREWDTVVLAAEWETGFDGMETYVASCAMHAKTGRYLGYVLNAERASRLLWDGAKVDVDTVALSKFGSGRTLVLVDKSTRTERGWRLTRSLGPLCKAVKQVAEVDVCVDHDAEEIIGNLYKGLREGQTGFEVQLQDERGDSVGLRAWKDGGVQCEAKARVWMGGVHFESLRCFDGGQVVYESVGNFVSLV